MFRRKNTSFERTLRATFDRRVIQNAFALYASTFGNYILPLVTVPYLARVLGPETWGAVLFVQAIGLYLVMVVDYSFDMAAGRQIARYQNNPVELSKIVAGVMGARTLLAFIAVTILAIAQLLVPTLRETGTLLWFGMFFYLGVAFRPFWFFLGIERVRRFVITELCLKALAVAGIVLLVNSPVDAWRVLGLQGLAATGTVIFGMASVYRAVPFMLPSVSRTVTALQEGWNLFLLRLSSSVYSMGNTVILGFLASPAIVGFYAGAERIIRLLVSLMFPVLLALFPRATGLATDAPESAAKLARLSTQVVFILASAGCAVLYFLSPFIIRITLGPGYEEAARTLRILLLLLPITGPTLALSTHWIIPTGLEGLLTKITLAASLMHIPLAILLGFQYAHLGIAWALVITETFIVLTLLTLLVVRGLGPFRFNIRQPAPESTVLQ